MFRKRAMVARGFSGRARRLRVESLEPRILLAGDTYLVNFQLAGAPTPTRYLPDVGFEYGDRGGGLSYGWTSDHTDVSRDRDDNADQRLDTLIHFHENQQWELGLPNGTYEVTVSIGDPSNPSEHTLNVEGAIYWSNEALLPNEFRQLTSQVTVADGRLTLDQGAAIEKATRINFVHVVGLPAGANAPPATPTITEPAVNGQVVNPADVHMEASGFMDGDGNAHKSTDWEIWSVGPGAAPVWQTLGIEGVERLHTHLGDGVFVGTHAGRTSFLGNTDYELRVRFRDDAGAVSAYALRQFHTAAASLIFPMEIQDVAAAPASTWVDAGTKAAVELPSTAPNQSQLRIESAAGELMLSIEGLNGVGNAVTNPPALHHHADLRVVIIAGSGGLSLGDSNLSFHDDGDEARTIYLPVINLAPNARLDLWVAADGATYYGAAGQTTPDFSTLARASASSVNVPYTALMPGFVIEEVAGEFQLPTNIAFVPNPGTSPNSPLFYVTELYGTIKVVRRNFVVSDYAMDLLNFDPTGFFPGSGEQGLTGITVDPVSGDVFATRVTATNPLDPFGAHHPQVLRFTSVDGGISAASMTVIRDMVGESQGQSHQISNLTIGPADGLLYVHNGDGFDASTAQNLNSYRGKILRMNLNGTAPTDNPFYNSADGITSRDYVFAYGLRNPFGGAWRAADGRHYEVENGPSVDRFARVLRGVNYGWNGSDASMTVGALYNWNPATAPVNIAFVQQSTFGGSQFPLSMQDRAFVSESGPTYATGPQANGKRITQFEIDLNGIRVSGPTPLIAYSGSGQGTVVGLAAGPDGLYFTELYRDLDALTPIDRGARVFRVRYVDNMPGDYEYDNDVDGGDVLKWQRTLGATNNLAADGNRSGQVDAGDLAVWRDNFGQGSVIAAAAPLAAAETGDDKLSLLMLGSQSLSRGADAPAVKRGSVLRDPSRLLRQIERGASHDGALRLLFESARTSPNSALPLSNAEESTESIVDSWTAADECFDEQNWTVSAVRVGSQN